MKWKVLFKHENLNEEWPHLLAVNPWLVYLVLRFADQMHSDIELTEIYRTQAMQRNYYPHDPDKLSVHEFWRGVDVSIRGLDESRLHIICDALNSVFPYDPARPEMKSFLIHDIGLGVHLHIQTLNGGIA